MTRNHIRVWHEPALPPASRQVTLRSVLRGSLLPLLFWAAVAGAVSVRAPLVAAGFGGFFAVSSVVRFWRRRRRTHTVRCSLYGALGGVFAHSGDGF
ncbi:hypothetical protein [Streptomyces sp. NPDC060198]|uniref:hypothetical protein n=1 Tax=Streptomyces sp. NPDC060198 TaxID=3347070 RepID=UPI003660C505